MYVCAWSEIKYSYSFLFLVEFSPGKSEGDLGKTELSKQNTTYRVGANNHVGYVIIHRVAQSLLIRS